MVNVRGLAAAARRGILVRSAGALHELARIDTVVLDKTGTVTAGCVEVHGIAAACCSERELLASAASAAAGSRHPASRAVLAAAAHTGVAAEPARRCEEIPGHGVIAEMEDGRRILLGRPQWIARQTAGTPHTDTAALACAVGKRVLGGFTLHDPVTAEAREAVNILGAAGLRLALLSGDAPATVADAARVLGISDAEGALLPEDKAARIGCMRAAGRRVAMVGDGINDAPALASAAVGIAASGGNDVARETAQIVMLRPGLLRVVEAWRLARATRRMGWQNLAWAAGYNSLSLGAAASGSEPIVDRRGISVP
jgi:P-type E1-E2 ATPase